MLEHTIFKLTLSHYYVFMNSYGLIKFVDSRILPFARGITKSASCCRHTFTVEAVAIKNKSILVYTLVFLNIKDTEQLKLFFWILPLVVLWYMIAECFSNLKQGGELGGEGSTRIWGEPIPTTRSASICLTLSLKRSLQNGPILVLLALKIIHYRLPG